MEDKEKSAEQLAKKDIMKSMKKDNPNYYVPFAEDKWNVTGSDIFNSKSRKLNKRLGISKINKEDNIKNIKRRNIKTFEEFNSDIF